MHSCLHVQHILPQAHQPGRATTTRTLSGIQRSSSECLSTGESEEAVIQHQVLSCRSALGKKLSWPGTSSAYENPQRGRRRIRSTISSFSILLCAINRSSSYTPHVLQVPVLRPLNDPIPLLPVQFRGIQIDTSVFPCPSNCLMSPALHLYAYHTHCNTVTKTRSR